MAEYTLEHPLRRSIVPVLDGEPQFRDVIRFATASDGFDGFVERYARDEAGTYRFTTDEYGEPRAIAREVVLGRVVLGIVLVPS